MTSNSVGFNVALIPKLEGSINYEPWKASVSSSLKASGVWKHISGTATLPVTYEGEQDHTFQDRIELYHTKMAQACNIIFSSCKPYIQMTLKDIEDPKVSWEKLRAQYESDGLIHAQHLWSSFALLKFDGGPIDAFCAKYRSSLDKCHTADIIIPDKIKILHFIDILDPHYDHWGANKREQMRRNPTVLPSLDTLMNEIFDECRRSSNKDEIIPHRSSFYAGQSSTSSASSISAHSRSPQVVDNSSGSKKL